MIMMVVSLFVWLIKKGRIMDCDLIRNSTYMGDQI